MDSKWDKIIEDKIKLANERGSKKRGWVVLRKSWLTSSINYRMELNEQAVFSKLIVMADEFGPVPGLISDNDLRPMPHEYLAHLAFCTLEVFEATLAKGIKDDSIHENSHGIFLTHFDTYQFTEYDRQKSYREDKRKKLTYNEVVLLSVEEYQKLLDTFGEEGTKKRIESLALYIQSKGNKYKSHYHTILNWERMNQKELPKDNPDKYIEGNYGHMIKR